jgi:hypothetical protein
MRGGQAGQPQKASFMPLNGATGWNAAVQRCDSIAADPNRTPATYLAYPYRAVMRHVRLKHQTGAHLLPHVVRSVRYT